MLDPDIAKYADALLSTLTAAVVGKASWYFGGAAAEMKLQHNQLSSEVQSLSGEVQSLGTKLDYVKITLDKLYGALVLNVKSAP